jgi:tRNA A-37 threonylcarbamoyl transferase component Bud32
MTDIIINPKYHQLEDFIKSIPASFSQSGKTIYAERNEIKVYNIKGLDINIKSFKKPIFINQVVYSTFRKSKAKRSYEYASKLKERGFHTPDPIAYIEQKNFGLLKKSFYVSINEQFDGLMRELRYGVLEGRENLLRQFAQYTADLHEKQILHLDYSSGNILYKKEGNDYSFYLVDLNRMVFDRPVNINTACFNFRRLWGSDEMISFFVKEYAKQRGFDTTICLDKTFRDRKIFWDTYIRNHPGISPYDDI